MRYLYFVVMLLFISTSHAQVYKCVVDGKTGYSQQPCADDAEQLNIHSKDTPNWYVHGSHVGKVSSESKETVLDNTKDFTYYGFPSVPGMDGFRAGGSNSVTSGGGDVNVKGYHRKDGTYVRPHTRGRSSKRK